MTDRRKFIKAAAVLPPALAYLPRWAMAQADSRNLVIGPATATAPGSNAKPVASATVARDPSRLALVIGNSAYGYAPLANPVNDARAISTLLASAGFGVDSLLNAKRGDMMAAIERFGTALRRPEVKQVVFYYAGHGAQLDWRNYLLPVDAAVENADHLKQRCVDLSVLLGTLGTAKEKTFVVVLDACRNNPFGSRYRPPQKGLSQFDAPVGSLLAYATSPGNVASDGEGQNGLYTENLVRELSRRNTRVEDALKRVRLNVRLSSKGAQVPWETTSLEGDVYLFAEGQKKLSETELEQQAEADMTEWARIKNSKKLEDWVGYLRDFPNGRFAEIAQMRLARLLAEAEERAAAERARMERERLEQERQRLAEEQRQAEERRLIEEKRLAEELRRAEEQRLAEERRMAEELKRAEEQRLAAERRQREASRLKEEQARQEAIRQAERERLVAEQTRQRQEALLAEQRRQRDEEARQAEERRRKDTEEAERMAREATRLAEERKRLAQQAETGKPAKKPAAQPGNFLIDIGPGKAAPRLIASSSNPFSAGRYPLGRIFTVGDSVTQVRSDLLTGIENPPREARVTRVDVDQDRVELAGGAAVLDLMGNVAKGFDGVEYPVPSQFAPSELYIGKKWLAAYVRIDRRGKTNGYYNMSVVKRETITVKAGSFDCFRIEGEGWNLTGGSRLQATLWIIPGVNFAIRREFMVRNRIGQLIQTDRFDLVATRQQAGILAI